MLVITSPRQADLEYLRTFLAENKINNVDLFLSKVDNMYSCRNWGFVWAYINNIIPKFYCSMDDDIEFISDSRDVLPRLTGVDYSVMTFNNNAQHYDSWQSEITGTCRVIPWMNGDSMFTRFEDNLLYGLPDCLPHSDPMPICTESEYQQRLCALMQKPLLADCEKIFYFHHFRDSQDKIALRDSRIIPRIKSGIDFFRYKFPGIGFPKEVDINKVNIHGIMRAHIMAHPEQAHKHVLYDGEFIDYPVIYNRIASDFTHVYGGY